MSVGSVLASRSQSWTSVSSLEETSQASLPQEPVLSIEELRLQLNSCFSCGVSWQDDHVSLDCAECGGYSLERPCPLCEGHCAALWKRDLTMSHASGQARWLGQCTARSAEAPLQDQRLCPRIEKLTATS